MASKLAEKIDQTFFGREWIVTTREERLATIDGYLKELREGLKSISGVNGHSDKIVCLHTIQFCRETALRLYESIKTDEQNNNR